MASVELPDSQVLVGSFLIRQDIQAVGQPPLKFEHPKPGFQHSKVPYVMLADLSVLDMSLRSTTLHHRSGQGCGLVRAGQGGKFQPPVRRSSPTGGKYSTCTDDLTTAISISDLYSLGMWPGPKPDFIAEG